MNLTVEPCLCCHPFLVNNLAFLLLLSPENDIYIFRLLIFQRILPGRLVTIISFPHRWLHPSVFLWLIFRKQCLKREFYSQRIKVEKINGNDLMNYGHVVGTIVLCGENKVVSDVPPPPPTPPSPSYVLLSLYKFKFSLLIFDPNIKDYNQYFTIIQERK